MKEMVIYGAFVNNQGGISNNMGMDLDVEHRNRFFKEHFTLTSHEPESKVLDRLSFSQDKLQLMLDNFYNQFAIRSARSAHKMNRKFYHEDVVKLCRQLANHQLFIQTPGRTLFSSKLLKSSHDPLLRLDMYNFKQWLAVSYGSMCKDVFFK